MLDSLSTDAEDGIRELNLQNNSFSAGKLLIFYIVANLEQE